MRAFVFIMAFGLSMERLVDIIDDLRVRHGLLAAEAISGDHDKAVAWLQEPIATFGGEIALELVAEGRTGDLLVTSNPLSLVTSVEPMAHDEHVTSVAQSSVTDVTNGRYLDELRQRRRGNV